MKTNFQQLCFQVPPQGPWGKAWFSGQAPATLRSLLANNTGSASHFPQSSWHQLPKPSWKHSAGVRRALQMPGLIGNPTLKQRQPCSRASTQHWLVGGWGRQPEGRLGPSSQGSSCGSGRLACSLISEPLHYHNQQLPITGHPERAEFFWSSFY